MRLVSAFTLLPVITLFGCGGGEGGGEGGMSASLGESPELDHVGSEDIDITHEIVSLGAHAPGSIAGVRGCAALPVPPRLREV